MSSSREKADRPDADNQNDFVVVPEYLAPDQNIADQPPFTWLELDEEVFPDDFFIDNPDAFHYFLRAAGCHTPTSRGLYTKNAPLAVISAYSMLSPQYQNIDTFLHVTEKLKTVLETKYSYSIQYIQEVWGVHTRLFDPKGQPYHNSERRPTYAAYYAGLKQLRESAKLTGLDEVLPSAAAVTEVNKALPPKNQTNRIFRLFRSGALE